MDQAMDYLYKSIAIMLLDAQGQNPDEEWLSDTLPWDIAQDLMVFLNPDMEGADEGNSLAASGGTETSTPITSLSPS